MRWTEEEYARYVRGDRDGAMTEKQLLARVRAVAKRRELLCYHTHRSAKSEPGFPDIVLCGGGGLWLYELKLDDTEPTLAQEHWLRALERVTRIATGIVRPSTLEAFVRSLPR